MVARKGGNTNNSDSLSLSGGSVGSCQSGEDESLLESLNSNDNVGSDGDEKKETGGRNRLVLHFDINETIVIGDEAGGDSRTDCLNKILAKSALVQIPHSREDPTLVHTRHLVPTHWWNGAPMDSTNQEEVPPLWTDWKWPMNACPYYRTSHHSRAKRFTDDHGTPYRPLVRRMNDRLSRVSSSSLFADMIPAFFQTLATLSSPYTLVLRTFGSDLQHVMDAIGEFAKGNHPLFPDFRNDDWIQEQQLERCMFRGRYRTDDDGATIYELFHWTDEDRVVASGDDEILSLLERSSLYGIQDDYHFWSSHCKSSMAGKPVWVRPTCHHIFFDDNIQNDPTTNIVSVRYPVTMDGRTFFRSMNGEQVLSQHGTHIVRVPTFEAIMDDHWFLHQIEHARSMYAKQTL